MLIRDVFTSKNIYCIKSLQKTDNAMIKLHYISHSCPDFKKAILFQVIGICVIVLLSTGCSRKTNNQILTLEDMENLKRTEWDQIAGKSIFFGHQSVGNNILAGIEGLRPSDDSSGLRIIETRELTDFSSFVFAHSRIGKNHDPKSKIDDFVNVLRSGIGEGVDLALMKLCYVDFKKETDIKDLFEYYKSSANKLSNDFPDLKIIHCTVPLTIKPQGMKGLAFRILKMDGNLYRHRYNEFLRKNYDKNEIFDIAAIESTFNNGKQNLYDNGIPALVNDYASDNEGHLNIDGQKLLAYHLLKTLLSDK